MAASIEIGTAGWSVPKQLADQFPATGSALERYSARFRVVEVNSSFYRPHRSSTWERWRDSVPEDFRFSVKLPKTITHVAKLADCADELTGFMGQVRMLGEKLGVLLVQLPPKLDLNSETAAPFFADLRGRTQAAIVCEPRNLGWFTPDADALLRKCRVARVAADPAICPAAAIPGGWRGIAYWRLHGSPSMYRSSYADRIDQLAAAIASDAVASEAWCIFDNTASSAATADALALGAAIERYRDPLTGDRSA